MIRRTGQAMIPNVSIIIATLNAEETLDKALRSVVTQSYQDWECIIIDGCSQDSTMNIISKYAVSDSRIRYVSEPDDGIYDAFNKGMRMAKGEWIHYLGSDDHLTPDGISELLACENDDVEVISGNCYIERIDGTIKHYISHGFIGCHQGKLVRRSTLNRFSGFNPKYRISADRDLMVRMEKAGVKIAYVDTFVAYFSMKGVSQNIGGLIRRSKERYWIAKANDMDYAFFNSFMYAIMDFLTISYRWIRSKLGRLLVNKQSLLDKK